jgi:hypothetical protein
VQRAITELPRRALVPHYADPTTIEVTFLTADMAESCAVIHGAELLTDQPRTVRVAGYDRLALFRAFVGMIQITRALVE